MFRSTQRPVIAGSRLEVDPSWRGLYKAGGIAAFAYILLGIVVPALLFIPVGYERGLSGEALLTFIADHRTWWFILQTLTLGPSFLAMPVFLAIFVALKGVNKSYAAIGALLAISCQLLFVSFYPGTLGMAFLSAQYMAADPALQESLAAAALGVTAPLDAFNPLYETVFAGSILILSLVMFRGVFPRAVAYMGLATAGAEMVAISLTSQIGMGYFWWYLFFVFWFAGVGWRLYQLGTTPRRVKSAPSDTRAVVQAGEDLPAATAGR